MQRYVILLLAMYTLCGISGPLGCIGTHLFSSTFASCMQMLQGLLESNSLWEAQGYKKNSCQLSFAYDTGLESPKELDPRLKKEIIKGKEKLLLSHSHSLHWFEEAWEANLWPNYSLDCHFVVYSKYPEVVEWKDE